MFEKDKKKGREKYILENIAAEFIRNLKLWESKHWININRYLTKISKLHCRKQAFTRCDYSIQWGTVTGWFVFFYCGVFFFFLIKYLNWFFELNIALNNQIIVSNCVFCSEADLFPQQKHWIQHRGSNGDPEAVYLELHRIYYLRLKYSCLYFYTDCHSLAL